MNARLRATSSSVFPSVVHLNFDLFNTTCVPFCMLIPNRTMNKANVLMSSIECIPLTTFITWCAASSSSDSSSIISDRTGLALTSRRVTASSSQVEMHGSVHGLALNIASFHDVQPEHVPRHLASCTAQNGHTRTSCLSK